ncbi:DUF563 domain-containing protein [Colletotrichum paranaense]|uniref:EGF domain-specific O-linked N-acetylglucosamine transferase n=1 Tax=Colletotrichum paranaense TaxID=1914294 RepID=A0ABQ9T1K3_9PEZI|nr:DUF563 domain-containing protein [Colletotrichum paranaense]KAK1545655.1 DUF563 domain-containing protein [Colletotrichum paranaense]
MSTESWSAAMAAREERTFLVVLSIEHPSAPGFLWTIVLPIDHALASYAKEQASRSGGGGDACHDPSSPSSIIVAIYTNRRRAFISAIPISPYDESGEERDSDFSTRASDAGHTQSNDNRDSFCIGQGAVLDRESGKFHVDCDVRQPTGNETANGIISFSNIRNYWYDTGPGFLFQNFVNVQAGTSPSSVTQAPTHHGSRPFTILVKREGHSNIWHSLMEIWSMVMSLDVLRLSHDGNDLSKPFFTIPGDVPRTQVVFLDNQEEGPLYPLWGMFAGREPLRLSKVLEDPVQAQALAETPQNLIIPLAGGSNPLWQNDWEDRDCKDAPLLKVFTRRVMQQFGVEFETGRRQGKPLNVTLIDRRGSRKLLDQEVLLDAARKAFPDANFQAIDLGAVTFPEQLRIVQSTDILVGVHGAGLTHTMFLRENGAAVVEIQPSSMSHKGFRNVAQMLGHKYFSTHAEMVGHEEDDKGRKRGIIRRDRWHWADIRIEEGAFLELIGQAVEAMRE